MCCNFTYGNFGVRTSVSVGNRILATYNHTAEAVDDRKNNLDRLDYGNGDRVEYEYDNKGRVTKESYEDGATVQYLYNNDGNLAKVMDSATGITTTYYYDLTDRMMKYE